MGRKRLPNTREISTRIGVLTPFRPDEFAKPYALAYLAEKGCRYSVGVTMHRVVAERIALTPRMLAARGRLLGHRLRAGDRDRLSRG